MWVFSQQTSSKFTTESFSDASVFSFDRPKTQPQRDSNPQSSDWKSDALSVGPCGLARGIQVLIAFKRTVLTFQYVGCPPKTFLPILQQNLSWMLQSLVSTVQKLDHRGNRTPNLLIRSQTSYPLGQAAWLGVFKN